MRIKSFSAAAGVLTALAVFIALPAFAQTGAASNVPVCVQCHETQNTTILLTAHGAQNDAERKLVPGVPRRRIGAPEGSRQEQAGERARLQDRDRGREIGGVPRLPRVVAPPRELGGREAPQGRRHVRQLPLDARHAVGEQQQGDQGRAIRGRAVHDDRPPARLQALRRVPPRRARRDPQALAPPDHRRQGRLPGLPRPARRAQSRRACATSRSSTCARPATPTSAARGSTSIRRSRKTAPSATRRTARRTRACSRRSRRRCAPTVTPTATRTASTTDAGRCRHAAVEHPLRKPAAASTAIGRSTAATRRRPPTANTSSAETRGRS